MTAQKKNVLIISATCTVAYMFVYFLRNILSVVTPQMIDEGIYTKESIGYISSVFFVTYAIGQLVNGILGDIIKSKYMICLGLTLAGASNLAFCFDGASYTLILVSYGLCGFFLSMIYGPMTKLVAENMNPKDAYHCSVAYNFSSYIGSPIAAFFAILLSWALVFLVGGLTLIVTGITCFIIFTYLEKKGAITYRKPLKMKESGKGIKALIEHKIIKFTAVSFLTGIIRTSVVFWLTTYYHEYLNYSEEASSAIFGVASVITSLNAFAAIFVYQKLNRNIDLTLILSFGLSAVAFGLCIIVKQPIANIILVNLGLFASNCSATMLWSRYCPGLSSTGLVSSATGFLDCVSYGAAAIANVVFANAVGVIGWKWLIAVWSLLMVLGVLVSIPYDKNTHYLDE